jgi:hypothetical protein
MQLLRTALWITAAWGALLLPGCGGSASSHREAKANQQAEIACPMYCINGDAACFFEDGSCQFACNQCLCESTGGQWNPGIACQ